MYRRTTDGDVVFGDERHLADHALVNVRIFVLFHKRAIRMEPAGKFHWSSTIRAQRVAVRHGKVSTQKKTPEDGHRGLLSTDRYLRGLRPANGRQGVRCYWTLSLGLGLLQPAALEGHSGSADW